MSQLPCPSPPLARTLEPAPLDEAAEARVYASMNHSEVDRQFVDDLLAAGSVGSQVIDLGTGTARIPVLLCRRLPHVRVMAIDAATPMLDLAATQIDIGGVLDQVQLQQGDAQQLSDFDDAICDCVISNSLLHHIADSALVLREALRLVRPGGRVFIRDLMRPATSEQVDRLTALHAEGESPEARQLLHQSLHAALSIQEVRELVAGCGLPPTAVRPTSDRHWTIDAECLNSGT